MWKFELSLRWKFLAVMSAGLLVAGGLTGTLGVYQFKKSFTEEINNAGQERALLIAAAVTPMILGYDYGNLELVARRFSDMQDIQKINMFNRDGKLMVSTEQPHASTERAAQIIRGGSIVAPVFFLGEKIGSVELIVSGERVHQQIEQAIRDFLIVTVLSTIFFGMIIYYTVLVLLTRPLARLSLAAEQVAFGNFSVNLPNATGDEMGVLVQAFSSMRKNRQLNEARLTAIFENAPDAMIQLDERGMITNWNEHAVVMFGYDKKEVLGTPFNLVRADRLKEQQVESGEIRATEIYGEESVTRDVLGRRKDGSNFPLELKSCEVTIEEERVYIISARDMSERKAAEDRVIKAMHEAEVANAAKSTFLSNMSHEIRTPMNSIIGMTHLTLLTPLNSTQHDYLTKINFSALHLLQVMNDLLDYAKIDANKLALDLHDFDLQKVVESVSNQLGHTAESKGLSLDFDLDPRLPLALYGDQLRLTQVLLNYTSNAIKFTPHGAILVRVILLEEGVHELLLRFEVEDTGIGMDTSTLGEVFKAFHQADISTTRKYGGSGLGLTISKQLVELMGGEVGVSSQLNQGSNFWFTARMGRGKASVATPPALPTNRKALAGLSILLVEDNLFNQQVAEDMLKGVVASVSVAVNGQEALEELGRQDFDCVLMDMQMPVMDGLEASRKIRSTPALANTYIIALTANAGKEDRERCLAAGMNDFVSKPIFAETLYAAIAKSVSAETAKMEEHASVDIAGGIHAEFSADAATDADLIDLSVLARVIGSDPAKIQKFAFKFLDSAQQGLAEMEQALAQNNLQDLAALGHKNKSPAKTVGAFSYAALSMSLEQFKSDGEIASARDIVTQMRVLLQKIEQKLRG